MTQDVNATYMSSPQAAKILRITYVGVAQLARQGKIPAVKIANRWLIPRAFVEEFAQTYEGRRGRPRKKGPSTECPETPASAIQPDQLGLANTSATSEVRDSKPEAGEIFALSAQADHQEEIPASMTQPGELGQRETGAVSEDKVRKLEADETFAVSAEVYHLDQNYDFELYEKGQITERARLIVARLKPKIPSLPQFSFRWDYRYEHLNVDIHGVEPAVIDWFIMGENGYTGHLPRRLGGPDRAFEAIIWLPVTFVFRGRLTLVLRKNSATGEDSPSAATTSGGGLRRWWTKWPTAPSA
jgi:excisionase family DNA binding protein